MSAGLLRGTVLRVLSDGSTDGTTRLLASAAMDGESAKESVVVVSIPGRHEAAVGDGVLTRTGGLDFHPANASYGYAEAAPEPDVEARLARLMSARVLSVTTSRTPTVPGSSLSLGGKVLRRNGVVQDPVLERASAFLRHRSMRDMAPNVVLLQPASLPAPRSRWEALRGSVAALARNASRGRGPWLPWGTAEIKAMEALGRAWHEGPPSMRKALSDRQADTPWLGQVPPGATTMDADALDRPMMVVVPYDPVTPPHVAWHTLSTLPQGYVPKVQMASAALDEITAVHEMAHTVHGKFVPPLPRASLKHRRECFADAAAILSWLQSGGDPVQARLWADARHLGLLGGAADYLTGPCCDAAIAEGMSLRAAVARGGPSIPPASLFARAAAMPGVLADPAQVRRAVDEAMAAAGGWRAAMLRPERLAAGCKDAGVRECLARAVRALEDVWTPRDLVSGGALPAARTEASSLRAHVAQLRARGMGHLAARSVEVSDMHASMAPRPSRLEREFPASRRLLAWLRAVPGVGRLMLLGGRAEGVEASARVRLALARRGMKPPSTKGDRAHAPPVQPFVVLRQGERPVVRGMSGNVQPLYAMAPEERLDRMRGALGGMREVMGRNDHEAFSRFMQEALAAGASIVSDLAALKAASHYMPSTLGASGTETLVRLVEDMQREPSTPAHVEDTWEEWRYWMAHGPIEATHKALSSTLSDPVMRRVARHGMWVEGIAGGERLDMEGMVLARRDLRGRNLGGSRLIRPDFTACLMEGASLRDAVVLSPRFQEARCMGMDVERSGLSKEDFRGAASLPGVSRPEDSGLRSPSPSLNPSPSPRRHTRF